MKKLLLSFYRLINSGWYPINLILFSYSFGGIYFIIKVLIYIKNLPGLELPVSIPGFIVLQTVGVCLGMWLLFFIIYKLISRHITEVSTFDTKLKEQKFIYKMIFTEDKRIIPIKKTTWIKGKLSLNLFGDYEKSDHDYLSFSDNIKIYEMNRIFTMYISLRISYVLSSELNPNDIVFNLRKSNYFFEDGQKIDLDQFIRNCFDKHNQKALAGLVQAYPMQEDITKIVSSFRQKLIEVIEAPNLNLTNLIETRISFGDVIIDYPIDSDLVGLIMRFKEQCIIKQNS